jgi:hypothetical protein
MNKTQYENMLNETVGYPFVLSTYDNSAIDLLVRLQSIKVILKNA